MITTKNITEVEAQLAKLPRLYLEGYTHDPTLTFYEFLWELLHIYNIKYPTLVVKTKEQNCITGRHRSLTDLYPLVLTYYPDVKLQEMREILCTWIRQRWIGYLKCGTISRGTYYPLANPKQYPNYAWVPNSPSTPYRPDNLDEFGWYWNNVVDVEKDIPEYKVPAGFTHAAKPYNDSTKQPTPPGSTRDFGRVCNVPGIVPCDGSPAEPKEEKVAPEPAKATDPAPVTTHQWIRDEIPPYLARHEVFDFDHYPTLGQPVTREEMVAATQKPAMKIKAKGNVLTLKEAQRANNPANRLGELLGAGGNNVKAYGNKLPVQPQNKPRFRRKIL